MPNAEISTRFILLHAFQEKKELFVPYTYMVTPLRPGQPKSAMDLVSLHSQDDYESLQPDLWGIPTPSQETIAERSKCLWDDEIDPDNQFIEHEKRDCPLDIIIMPGLAFDEGLSRIGHGKGFYDFFLQRYQKIKASNNDLDTKMPFLGNITTLQKPQSKPI